jgi:hypothetical protein
MCVCMCGLFMGFCSVCVSVCVCVWAIVTCCMCVRVGFLWAFVACA